MTWSHSADRASASSSGGSMIGGPRRSWRPGPTSGWSDRSSLARAARILRVSAHPVYQEVQLHGPTTGSSPLFAADGPLLQPSFLGGRDSVARPAASGRPAPRFRRRRSLPNAGRKPGRHVSGRPRLRCTRGRGLGQDRLAPGTVGAGAARTPGGTGAPLALAEAGRTATRIQIVATIQPGTFTHRLRYGWRWTSADGITR